MAECGKRMASIGFHAQQAADTAVKAVLVTRGGEVPNTHDLGLLLDIVAETIVTPESVRGGLAHSLGSGGTVWGSKMPRLSADLRSARLTGRLALRRRSSIARDGARSSLVSVAAGGSLAAPV